jgi:hypothetical protein
MLAVHLHSISRSRIHYGDKGTVPGRVAEPGCLLIENASAPVGGSRIYDAGNVVDPLILRAAWTFTVAFFARAVPPLLTALAYGSRDGGWVYTA